MWHFCTNCSEWPTEDYVASDTRPIDGELDYECCAKSEYSECRESIWGVRAERPRLVRSGKASPRHLRARSWRKSS